jgi:hypothetical protein
LSSAPADQFPKTPFEQRISADPIEQLAGLLPDKWLADRTAAAS